MALPQAVTVESSLAKAVLRLLSGLRRTPAGEAIFRHVSTVLRDNETNHTRIEQAYAELLQHLLTAFVDRVPQGSPFQVQLRLIAMHLAPPLSIAEITTLRNCLQVYTDEIDAHTELNANSELVENALAPLLQEFSQGTSAKVEPKPLSPTAPTVVSAPAIPTSGEPVPFVERRQSSRTQAAIERRVDSAYRQHLNEKQQSIQRVQQQLAQHITDTMRQSEEFSVLLEVEMDALKQAGTHQELDILRKTLVTEVEKLQHAHEALTERLGEAHKYLQLVEADSQHLQDELTRVHLLSLTDELTSLPNRRAFMRRLEDEVGRVQRYGSVLSLIVIDLDLFKTINDQFGHAAGDEILRTYTRQVLSIFRHHDMVARYGGEEFAVLLPNTDIAGAAAAVAKVQRRVSEVKVVIESTGTEITLPTFSAGIALYQAGETPTDLIERADVALYRAKNAGRNRVEIAPLTDTDAALA